MELIGKRTVQKLDIEGFGEIFVRRPSAAFFLNAARIADSRTGPAERGWTMLIELVSECVVDSEGKPVITAENKADLDPKAVALVGKRLEEMYAFSQVAVLEKNSGSAPSGSLPTDSPAGSGALTSTNS